MKDTYMAISKDEEESVRAAAPWDLEPLDGQVYMEYEPTPSFFTLVLTLMIEWVSIIIFIVL